METGGIKLAKSRSGHDRGEVFVIVKEEDNYVFLADGVGRTVEKPKKKNRRHIQVIHKIPPDAAELLSPDTELKNTDIKRALKLYMRQSQGTEDCPAR
ncbi:MAG: KOW domain-containing RNA-binding protein [Clostridiales bacterium]|nr:KOW domain-containing RNA-binding protein [Clostridiales bacterium]